MSKNNGFRTPKLGDSKLFTLRKWLTIPETSQHLSTIFNEEVSEADVLQLVLDDHLKIAAKFLNPAKAKPAKIMNYPDYCEWLFSKPEFASWSNERKKDYKNNNDLKNKQMVAVNDDEVTLIGGIWDLHKDSIVSRYLDHKIQEFSGRAKVESCNLVGCFVHKKDGQILELTDEISWRWDKMYGNLSVEKRKNLTDDQRRGISILSKKKALHLPDENIDLVIRTNTLLEFQEKIFCNKVNRDKPLHPQEKTSLLKMIYVMSVDGYGYDPDASKSSLPREIAEAAATFDLPIDEDTVRKWLKEANNLPRKDDF